MPAASSTIPHHYSDQVRNWGMRGSSLIRSERGQLTNASGLRCQWSDKRCQIKLSYWWWWQTHALTTGDAQSSERYEHVSSAKYWEKKQVLRIEYIIDTNHLETKRWSGFKEGWYFWWRAELNVLYSYFCQDLVSLGQGVVSFAKNAEWNMRGARGSRRYNRSYALAQECICG